MDKRPLIPVGLVFFLSLIAVNYIPLYLCAAAGALCLAIGTVILAVRRLRPYRLAAAALLAAAAASLLFSVNVKMRVEPVQCLDGLTATVTGYIAEEPEYDGGRYTYIIKTESIDAPGAKQNIKVRVTTYSKLGADMCDRVTATVRFYTDSGEYRFKNYSSGVYVCGFISGGSGAETQKAVRLTPYGYAVMLRRHMRSVIYDYLPEKEASVVSAVALNSSGGMPDDIKADFRDSGISHLLAVSGQHIGVIVQLFLALFSRFLSRRRSALLTAAPLIVFMAVTGFSPSVVRAGIMNIIYLAGIALSRRPDGLTSLSAALIVMCLQNPFNAVNVSLQLSAFATFGILCFARPLSRVLTRNIPKKNGLPGRILHSAFSAAAFSLASAVTLLPVSVLQFGYVSVVGVVTNVLVMYVSMIMLCLAVLLLIVSVIPFTSFILYPGMLIVGLCAKYTSAVAHIMAKIPFACVPTSYRFVYIWLAGMIIFAGLAALICRRRENIIKLTAVTAAVSLAAGALSYAVFYRDVARVGIISAGSGQTAVLTYRGQTAIIGCGGDASAVYNTKDYLKRRGIKKADAIIVPSYDKYFGAQAALIISEIDADALFIPRDENGTSPVTALDVSGADRTELTGHDRIDLCSGVYVTVDASHGAVTVYIGGTAVVIAAPGASPAERGDILVCGASLPDGIEGYAGSEVIIGVSEKSEAKTFERMRELGVDAYSTVDGDVIINVRINGGYTVQRGI